MYSPNLLHLALEYLFHISDYRLVIGTCISHKHLKLTMFMIALISLSSKASSPLCLVSSNVSGKTKLNRLDIWNSCSVLPPSVPYLCHSALSSIRNFHLLLSAIEYFKCRIIYLFSKFYSLSVVLFIKSTPTCSFFFFKVSSPKVLHCLQNSVQFLQIIHNLLSFLP